MIEYISTVMPCQVEVCMLSQVDQCCLVRCGFNQHLESALPGHDVGDRRFQRPRVSLRGNRSRVMSWVTVKGG